MNPSDERSTSRLQALFDHALQLDAAARARWLVRMHATAPADAAVMERLLARDRAGANPFDGAIDAMRQTLDDENGDWIGRQIGDFRILKRLGSGGMGSVFLAERQMRDFQQLVALKLLRALWLDPATLRHFAAERQILARLRHPCIATLIDADATSESQPYLVMEYVEGITLTHHCDRQRLDISARIRLARRLLGALAYAHRQLVVHRDLKPANVLVTADGTPKLLDFGLARLLGPEPEAGATATRAMTPAYASPEQLAGEPAGTASDLYSFGLILYELCVGVLPWASESRAASTADTLPAAPSQRFRQLQATRRQTLAARRRSTPAHLRKVLHGDLGRILRRCLDPDPGRRYASADALDIDLDALLTSRPPPGLQVPPLRRAATFARRHAWPLGLTAILVIATAALLVQSLRAAHRYQVQRDRAMATAAAARTEAAKSGQIAAFAQAMLSGIDPDLARGMDRTLMRTVLDRAAQRAGTELAGQPEVRAAIERSIAESYNAIGEYALAIRHFDAALAAISQLPQHRPDEVALRARKARALGNAGNLQQAARTARAAVVAASALPRGARDRLFARSTLAGFQCDLGAYQSCRDIYAEVYARQKEALGAHDDDTLSSASGLARAEDSLGHPVTAQRLYREVIAARRDTTDRPTSKLLAAINALAVSYLREGRFSDAEALLKPALADATALFGPNHPATIGMLSNLGGAIRQQSGRNAEARPYYEQVLAASRTRYGADGKRTIVAHINLALLLRDAGDLDGALAQAQASLASARRIFPASSPFLAILTAHTASIQTRRGELAKARQQLDQAWQTLQATPGFEPGHPWVRTTADYRAQLHAANKGDGS